MTPYFGIAIAALFRIRRYRIDTIKSGCRLRKVARPSASLGRCNIRAFFSAMLAEDKNSPQCSASTRASSASASGSSCLGASIPEKNTSHLCSGKRRMMRSKAIRLAMSSWPRSTIFKSQLIECVLRRLHFAAKLYPANNIPGKSCTKSARASAARC